jgi:hypothetical protein
MQAWLAGDDLILKAEAEQYFAAIAESGQVSFAAEPVQVEPHTGFLIEDVAMPGGFGQSQPKRRGGKTGLQEIRQLGGRLSPSTQEPQPDLVMQAEVGVAFAQYQQENPEEVALAWSLGVYNPLAKVDLLAVGARFLDPEEEDWLAIARMVEWLDVEDSLDVIYFTAPPPDFALEQADWYIRPDLTSFLEEPILLREVVQVYPIPLEEIQGAISQWFLQLGWTSQQQAQLILKLFEKPQAELTEDDWEFLLFELDSQLRIPEW